MKSSFALLFSGLAAQQVSATWDIAAKHFNTPQYNNNQCSDKQKGGFNWGDLPTGNFNNYGDFNFKGGSGGWTCANSFGKRDALTKRTFNPKCIKNKVKKDTPANIDCGNKIKDGFSVTEIEVSVEFDCDLEFHYTMPDQSICKQVKRCSKDGTLVQNTQCGGAYSVDIYLGNHDQKSRDDCEIGFHSIGFDCSPSYTPTKKPLPPPPSATPSKPALSASPPAVSQPPQTTTKAAEAPKSTFNTQVHYGNSSSPIATKPNTPPAVPGTSKPTLPSSPGSMAAVPSSTPKANNPGYTPPQCLPSCLNTWLELKSQCKDNTDASCYCKNPDFTKDVIDCVAAWSKNDMEIQQALQYLIGICAPQVPQNPGLITNCPSNIPLNPTNPPTPTGAPKGAVTPAPSGNPPPGPVTTITYKTTVTVPYSGGVNGSSSVSTMTTTLTVPQVVFTTNTPAQPPAPGVTPSQQPVALVPGTPSPVAAIPTGAPYPIVPAPTKSAPPRFGTGTAPGSNGTAAATGPAQFTGAASPVRTGLQPAVLGALLAFLAL